MNKDSFKLVGVQRGLQPVRDCYTFMPADAVSPSQINKLLDLIFKPDKDGVMRSDLALYLSDKVNPQIKSFIEQNLLQVQTGRVGQIPDGISEDDAIELSVRPYDSVESYGERVRGFLNRLKDENKDA